MEANAMKENLEKFISLCDAVKEKEARTYGVNEIEKELLNVLNFIKEHNTSKKEFEIFLIKIVKGIELYPLEIIIFCMRELQWQEIKNVALNEKNNTNDGRVISSMNHILEACGADWEDADMYEYYSKKD